MSSETEAARVCVCDHIQSEHIDGERTCLADPLCACAVFSPLPSEPQGEHLYPHEQCAGCGEMFETVNQRATHLCDDREAAMRKVAQGVGQSIYRNDQHAVVPPEPPDRMYAYVWRTGTIAEWMPGLTPGCNDEDIEYARLAPIKEALEKCESNARKDRLGEEGYIFQI